jgi:hypothetical protein
MDDPRLHTLTQRSERWYAFILSLYPKAYQAAYSQPMLQLFHDLNRDAVLHSGKPGLKEVWKRTVLDALLSLPVEYLDLIAKGDPMNNRPKLINIIILTGLPIWLSLVILVVNPRFVGKLFEPSTAQPWGWVMVCAALIFCLAAFFVQRKAALMVTPSGAAPSGKKALLVASTLFLVLPAVLVVLLGPAVMMVLMR